MISLAFWIRHPITWTAIPSSLISLLSTFALFVLTVLEHKKSIRPSSLVTIYLSAAIINDCVQLRTLILRGYVPSLVIISALSVAAKSIAFALESLSKQSYLKPAEDGKEYGSEELTSFFGRRLFFWLNPLFLRGNRNILTLEDLPPLDQDLLSDRIQRRSWNLWEKSKRKPSDIESNSR
jgi:ATP-binding cassette subfamily C (CFTR/MRP) protein 1